MMGREKVAQTATHFGFFYFFLNHSQDQPALLQCCCVMTFHSMTFSPLAGAVFNWAVLIPSLCVHLSVSYSLTHVSEHWAWMQMSVWHMSSLLLCEQMLRGGLLWIFDIHAAAGCVVVYSLPLSLWTRKRLWENKDLKGNLRNTILREKYSYQSHHSKETIIATDKHWNPGLVVVC